MTRAAAVVAARADVRLRAILPARDRTALGHGRFPEDAASPWWQE